MKRKNEKMTGRCKDIIYLSCSYLNIEEISSLENSSVIDIIVKRYRIYIPNMIVACDQGLYYTVKYLMSDKDKLYQFHETIRRDVIYNSFCKTIGNSTPEFLNIFTACRKGYLRIVKYLIEIGPITIEDCKVVMDLACNNGHLEIIKYLIEYGIVFDNNSINLARSNKHYGVIKYLKSRMSLFEKFKMLIF